jgi:hypothetical protein
MPINTDLLIAAPMLQDYLVDKDGTPMAFGTITCYQDNSRTTLKNWYYQSGSPGAYTYIPLPNPLPLSAAGTICDINGVDTIPFFYPYDENNSNLSQPYYITIVNKAQTNVITRQNFPFIPLNSNNPEFNDSFNNIIINGGFWRNIAPNTVNITPYTSYSLTSVLGVMVAPSQHDGFRFSDINFFKSKTGATESVTFTPFPLTNTPVIKNYIVPEYYLNHTCSGATTMEAYKLYRFPISLHVNTLANVPFTVSIQAQNDPTSGSTGTGENVISLAIRQDTGTGASSPAVTIPIDTITLNPTWTTYTFTKIFPGTSGLNLGLGADDALYLEINLPLNLPFSINFTKPSIFLTTNAISNNDFQTYDQVDTIINSPRTGDIRISANSFYPSGWVPMNDNLIGLSNSHSSPAYVRANADTWQLFNLLYNLALPYDSGSNFNPICQLYTVTSSSSQTAINYSGNAYTDFIGNSGQNALQLTKAMGRTLLGGVPVSALSHAGFTQTVTFTSSGGMSPILICNVTGVFSPFGSYFYQGQPVVFQGSLPSSLVTTFVYYVTNILSGTAFELSTTYAGAIAGSSLVPYAAGGPATIITSVNGTILGEYAHTQALNELYNHTHNPGSPGTSFVEGGTGALTINAGAGISSSIATTGGVTGEGTQVPFNVTQPGTYYNMYIKL